MSALEIAYRRAMQWYPHRWREENADALVALMLEVADAEGRTSPSAADLRNLRVNGLRARFAPLARLFPANARDRASGIALGFGLGMALTVLVIQEWAPWARPLWETYAVPNVGPFHGWGGVLYSAWVVASVLALARLNTAARIVLLATIPFSILLVAVGPFDDAWFRPTTLALAVLGGFALVAALGRPVTRAFNYLPMLVAVLVGAGVVLLPFTRNVEFSTLLSPGLIWRLVLQGTSGSMAVIATAAALVAVALIVRDPRWVATVVLLASPGLAVTLVSLSSTNPELVIFFSGVLAVLAVVATAVVLRVKGLRIALVRRS